MNSILPNANPNATEPDVILVGAGIMSATLGQEMARYKDPARSGHDIAFVTERIGAARRRRIEPLCLALAAFRAVSDLNEVSFTHTRTIRRYP